MSSTTQTMTPGGRDLLSSERWRSLARTQPKRFVLPALILLIPLWIAAIKIVPLWPAKDWAPQFTQQPTPKSPENFDNVFLNSFPIVERPEKKAEARAKRDTPAGYAANAAETAAMAVFELETSSAKTDATQAKPAEADGKTADAQSPQANANTVGPLAKYLLITPHATRMHGNTLEVFVPHEDVDDLTYIQLRQHINDVGQAWCDTLWFPEKTLLPEVQFKGMESGDQWGTYSCVLKLGVLKPVELGSVPSR